MTDLINEKNYRDFRAKLEPKQVRLIAVSKYSSDEQVEAMSRLGQKDFGESRPQLLRDRALAFPDLNWHMIGPLQKNKAKYIGRHADIWHSLSDIDVAKAVAKYVENRQLPVLIQLNISGESQKSGVPLAQLNEFVDQVRQIPELKLIGLMGMASKEGDIRSQFAALRRLRDAQEDEKIRELCMGMSGDWKVAVEEGATMVRIGRALFQSGDYK